MCNRICLSRDAEEIRRHFAVMEGKPRLKPSWNIAAGAVMPVVRWDNVFKMRRLDMMRWGLVAAWSENTRIVRASFHAGEAGDISARLGRRCLVPVENFYEWRGADNQPFAVALKSREIMALAGIWDFWFSPLGEQLTCFALITTGSRGALAPVCKRMPVLVGRGEWELWLNPDTAFDALWTLLQAPLTSQDEAPLDIWKVDRRLNNIRNDNPGLLAPLA
jgi:putative SOS response-associated peptidase YedK